MPEYEAYPLRATPQRAEIISKIVRQVAAHDGLFSDFQATCEEPKVCLRLPASEMCQKCLTRLQMVMRELLQPDARVFEVWEVSEAVPEVVGIIHYSDVRPGADAVGHYVFFDQKLASKTGIIQETMRRMFEELELRRLTVEIPTTAYALARHASRKLGFGGGFMHEGLAVEGVRRGASMKDGKPLDLMLMGLLREDFLSRNAHTQDPSPENADEPHPASLGA